MLLKVASSINGASELIDVYAYAIEFRNDGSLDVAFGWLDDMAEHTLTRILVRRQAGGSRLSTQVLNLRHGKA